MSDQPVAYPAIRYAETSESDLRRSAFVFLAISWLVSGLGANMPFADSVIAKSLLLLPPVAISLLLVLLNPRNGFAFWSFGLSLFVTQTGYQLDVGSVRLSAMELVVGVLLLVLAWSRRNGAFAEIADFHLPGHTILIMFTIYSILVFTAGLLREDHLDKMLIQFKGFLIYPYMTYLLVAGLRNKKILRWSIVFVVAWYSYVAGHGIWQYLNGEGDRDLNGLLRVSGDYAPINTYGITLVAIALLVLGITINAADRSTRIAGLAVTFWLFLGATVSVARTIWVAFLIGVLFLLATSARKRYSFLIIGLALTVFVLLPEQISGRILQLSDSSTIDRSFYLMSALQAWRERWLFGWGWGNSYWYFPSIGLVPTGDIPWYHNDYLNLAVQVGIVGVVLYLAYWGRLLFTAYRWSREHVGSQLAGYVSGGQAALVGLLVAAGFEHVLWRPDIAGLVGWLAGLTLAGMYLSTTNDAEAELR